MVTNFVNSAQRGRASIRGGVRAVAAVRLAATIALTALAGAREAGAAQSPSTFDHCFEVHALAQGLEPNLLRAIAQTESSMRPQAINADHLARTQSVDIGLMQINSRWLPELAKFGVTRTDLAEACTNIEVGAWILADLIRRKGSTWEAVGAYNAGCTELRGDACTQARARYAWRVYKNWPGRGSETARSRAKGADSAATRVATIGPGLVRLADVDAHKGALGAGASQ